MKSNIATFLLFIFSMLLGATVMYAAQLYAPFIFSSGNQFGPDTNCTNLNDTVSVAYCLNQEFSSFFVYNISNAKKRLNETMLELEGGVCTHAAEWYKAKLESMGFRAVKVGVYVNETVGHTYTRLEAKDAYCSLDQDDIHCFRYG